MSLPWNDGPPQTGGTFYVVTEKGKTLTVKASFGRDGLKMFHVKPKSGQMKDSVKCHVSAERSLV